MSEMKGKESLWYGKMYISALKTPKFPGPLSGSSGPAADSSLCCHDSNLLCQQLSASKAGPPLTKFWIRTCKMWINRTPYQNSFVNDFQPTSVDGSPVIFIMVQIGEPFCDSIIDSFEFRPVIVFCNQVTRNEAIPELSLLFRSHASFNSFVERRRSRNTNSCQSFLGERELYVLSPWHRYFVNLQQIINFSSY